MNTTPTMLITRTGAAAGLAVSGYIHAELYVHGYRVIPTIGPMFLLLAAASFAVALLRLIGGPPARSAVSPSRAPSASSASPNAACNPPPKP